MIIYPNMNGDSHEIEMPKKCPESHVALLDSICSSIYGLILPKPNSACAIKANRMWPEIPPTLWHDVRFIAQHLFSVDPDRNDFNKRLNHSSESSVENHCTHQSLCRRDIAIKN